MSLVKKGQWIRVFCGHSYLLYLLLLAAHKDLKKVDRLLDIGVVDNLDKIKYPYLVALRLLPTIKICMISIELKAQKIIPEIHLFKI